MSDIQTAEEIQHPEAILPPDPTLKHFVEKFGTGESPITDLFQVALQIVEYGDVAFLTIDDLLEKIRPTILDYGDYLEPVKIQGREVVDWSAEGIKAFSLFFGVSTGKIVIHESPNGNGALFSTDSLSIYTGQTSSATIFQAYQTIRYEGRGENRKKIFVDDIYWAEKGTTRVNRNARRNLLPTERLKIMLNESRAELIDAEKQRSTLMTEIGNVWSEVESAISPLTKAEALESAAEVHGPREGWELSIWQQFLVDLRNWSQTYLDDARKAKLESNNDEE